MPVLRPPISTLMSDTRFTAADLAALRRAIESRQATVEDAKTIATQYADTLEPGIGSGLRSLLQSLGSSTAVMAAIANLASDAGLLNGQITLPDSGRRHPSVRNVQRALIAIASRTHQPDLMLPQFGADGIWGNETQQVIRRFQQKQRLPVTGKVDVKTARALDLVLSQTHTPGIMSATPKDLAIAAEELCMGDIALNYGVPHPWVNIDPNHNVPVNRPFTPLINRWKCNLYGGNVMRKGGYEPPYYGNRGRGEYPNANQWFKWSDKYATQFGNRVHFQWIDEVPVEAMLNNNQETQARQAIARLLAKAQPGDFLMQDHPGTEISDGGHTRVAIQNQFHFSGIVAFAQAQFEFAEVQQEGIDDFMGAETIWLLRATVKM